RVRQRISLDRRIEPDVLLHEQEPLRGDAMLSEDPRELPPEVEEAAGVAGIPAGDVRDTIVAAKIVVPDVGAEGHDDAVVLLGEGPSQVADVEADAIRKPANHGDRCNSHSSYCLHRGRRCIAISRHAALLAGSGRRPPPGLAACYSPPGVNPLVGSMPEQ